MRILRCALVLLFPACTIQTTSSMPHEFYVSPSGNDRHTGTLQRPFRTIARARDAVREFRAGAGEAADTVKVYLRGGRYELSKPITLLPEDGGTARSPTLYAAYGDEQPVVSGGTQLTGWNKGGGGAYVFVTLPHRLRTRTIRQFWVNNQRRPPARHPNTGYLRIAAVPDIRPETPWNEGQFSFMYNEGDIPAWSRIDGAEAIVMNRWTESHLPVAAVHRDSTLLRFSWKSVYRLEPDDPYYLIHLRDALDTPGEWYLEKDTRRFLYIPVRGEEVTGVTAIVPELPQLLVIAGDPAADRYVEHLIFRGITFSHTDWHFSDDPARAETAKQRGGFGQAAYGLPAAIQADGLRHTVFQECDISHAGTYGIALQTGCSDNVIDRCRFTDLGGGGILIGDSRVPADPRVATGRNTVSNCEIADVGLVYHSAVGIWIGQSPGNRLIHNHIHDLYYSGISIGWTWGYGPSAAGGNQVVLNHVHHVGIRSDGDGPILADMGGIYTLGAQPGTIIRHNIFHDIAARVYGGWGIYYDEGSGRIVSEENLVYRTSHQGFHQHYGKDNVFRNNIIAFGRDHQILRDHHENHTSFAFERNIVYWDAGPMFNWEEPGWNTVFDRNIYWRTDGRDVMTDSLTFTSWQEVASDPRSRFTDPLFRNPRDGDFRLEPGSPAWAMGFRPIPYERILDTTPVDPAGVPQGPAIPNRRFLYNNDGSNILMAYDTLTPAKAYQRIDPLAGTGITTFLHNVNPGQNMGYPSDVAPMYTWRTPVDTSIRAWETYGRRMGENLARLVRDSLDPVGLVMDRARLRGMESMLTFRMNELHDVDKPASPLLSEFWKSHPEYRVGGYDGWGAYALNYAVPEVRRYVFEILSEVVGRYDLDGLELDFMRFPYYFPYHRDSMPTYAALMNGFIRQIRRMTGEIAATRGRQILLAVRVPSSLEGCAYVGLDPGTWSREGLVDFITVAPFLSTETDIPVREFKRECGSVPVYTGLEFTIGARMMTREEKRAAAALLYAAGSDGMYLFNYFVAWDVGLHADMDVLRELVHPDSLVRKDKLYTLAIPRYPVPNVSLPSALPLHIEEGERGAVVLRAHETVVPRTMTLRIECAADVDPANLRVAFNGVELAAGARPTSAMMYPQPVEYKPAPVSRAAEFDVPPKLLKEVNSVSILTGSSLRVDWMYLAVRH